jgi:hypothetical protein
VTNVPAPRYFVTLSATCSAGQLQTVVDHLSSVLPGIAGALPEVEGLSLSFTREDADEFTIARVAGEVPDALPVAPTVGVVEPPSGQHTAEQTLPTAPVPTDTDGSPA